MWARGAIALAGLLAAAPAVAGDARHPAPPLAIRLTAPQPDVLVGEPLILWLEYAGTESGYFACDLRWPEHERILIAEGAGEFHEVRVRRPGPTDQQLLDALGWALLVDAQGMTPSPLGEHASGLVRLHPRSPYLRLLRVKGLEARWRPANPVPRTGTEIPELFALARELAALGGPLAPRALLVLAGLYEEVGDDRARRRTLAKIVDAYPLAPESDLAREQLADLGSGR